MINLPRVPGSTGLCGNVECANTACWPRYSRSWNPVLEATSGPLAVALWSGSFRRETNWLDPALSLFERPPAGGTPVPRHRIIAVLQGWDATTVERTRLIERAKRADGGWVIASTPIDQSWEPRLVKIAQSEAIRKPVLAPEWAR